MESLPPGIIAQVVSHLDIEEQLKCRLVSRLFKNEVDYNLKKVTHLAFGKIYYEHDYYIFFNFLKNKLTKFRSMKNPTSFPYILSSKFLSSLSIKCPNIEVIYAHDHILKLENLLPFSERLKFFWCRDLDISGNGDQTVQLLCNFKQLECFEFSLYNTKYCHLVDEWLRLKRPLRKLKNPTEKILNDAYELVGDKGISSLKFNRSGDTEFIVPSHITAHLECFYSTQNDVKVKGPLYNIKYLYLYYPMTILKEIEQILLSTKLKVINFTFPSEMDGQFYRQFVNVCKRLDSLMNLEDVSFKQIRIKDSKSLPPVKCSLPPRIRNFTLYINEEIPIELTTECLTKLFFLSCNNFSTFKFNYSNLNCLKLDFHKLTKPKSSGDLFLKSLLKCTNLQYLTLQLNDNFRTLIHIQSLIDTMSTMTRLKKVTLVKKVKVDGITNPDLAVLIDQRRLKSVKEFKFYIATRVMFHPMQPGLLTFKRRRNDITYETETGAVFNFCRLKSFNLPPPTSIKYKIETL